MTKLAGRCDVKSGRPQGITVWHIHLSFSIDYLQLTPKPKPFEAAGLRRPPMMLWALNRGHYDSHLKLNTSKRSEKKNLTVSLLCVKLATLQHNTKTILNVTTPWPSVCYWASFCLKSILPSKHGVEENTKPWPIILKCSSKKVPLSSNSGRIFSELPRQWFDLREIQRAFIQKIEILNALIGLCHLVLLWLAISLAIDDGYVLLASPLHSFLLLCNLCN